MSDRMAVDLAHIRARPDGDRWTAAWRAKERWYGRWEDDVRSVLGGLDRYAGPNLRDAAAHAVAAHGRVEKGHAHEVAVHLLEILRGIIDRLFHGYREEPSGAVAVYTGLALAEGEDAGQFTLDALGLNRTFAWAGQRDFAGDAFAVRGSKIIQAAYSNHRERLAEIVLRATRPEAPRPMSEIIAEVRAEWSRLTAFEARRIAQTEAGIVWERTNWYAMRANGVQRVRWLVAHGPAIGVRVGKVCPACLAMAAGSPYEMDSLGEMPPKHPFCRCTLIPVLDARWLPPAEPWTGSELPLPTVGLDGDAGTEVPAGAPVRKARRRWGRDPDEGWSAARGWRT